MVQTRTTEVREMEEQVQRLQGAIGSCADAAEAKATAAAAADARAAAAAAADARAAAVEEARMRAEEETSAAREQLRVVEAAAAEAQEGFAAWRAKARTMMVDKEGEVTALQVRCDMMIPGARVRTAATRWWIFLLTSLLPTAVNAVNARVRPRWPPTPSRRRPANPTVPQRQPSHITVLATGWDD